VRGTTKGSKYCLPWRWGTPASLGAVHVTLAAEGKPTTRVSAPGSPALSSGGEAGQGQQRWSELRKPGCLSGWSWARGRLPMPLTGPGSERRGHAEGKESCAPRGSYCVISHQNNEKPKPLQLCASGHG